MLLSQPVSLRPDPYVAPEGEFHRVPGSGDSAQHNPVPTNEYVTLCSERGNGVVGSRLFLFSGLLA